MLTELELVIKSGTIVSGRGQRRADLGIKSGRVAEVSQTIDPARAPTVIDAAGLLVLPGVIDVHTHPVYLDDLGGTSVAAAYGGVTTMVHYAYARPGMKLLDTLYQFREQGLAASLLDFGVHAGMFDVEHQIDDIPAAFKEGVTSFKVFMTYAKLKWMTDDYWLTALLDVVGHERGLVAVHAENGLATDYLEDKYLREGRSPVDAFTAMRPDLLEAEALNRAMSIARVLNCALYVPHVSAAACLEPLRRARDLGWRVYGETCPQYLTLTEETTRRVGAPAKIGPPLRTAADNEALWQALADGTLLTVASDHAPKAKKSSDDFFAAPYGAPSIETMLPVVYDAGVNGGKIAICRLVEVMSENPARLFGLYPQKGNLEVGADADLLLWDPEREQTLRAITQHSAAGYTLYEGRAVRGGLVLSMQRGRPVVQNGELVAQKGEARFLRTDTSPLYA